MFVRAVCEVRISIYYFIRQNIPTAENTQTQTKQTYNIIHKHTQPPHPITKSIKEEKAKEKLLFCTDLT